MSQATSLSLVVDGNGYSSVRVAAHPVGVRTSATASHRLYRTVFITPSVLDPRELTDAFANYVYNTCVYRQRNITTYYKNCFEEIFSVYLTDLYATNTLLWKTLRERLLVLTNVEAMFSSGDIHYAFSRKLVAAFGGRGVQVPLDFDGSTTLSKRMHFTLQSMLLSFVLAGRGTQKDAYTPNADYKAAYEYVAAAYLRDIRELNCILHGLKLLVPELWPGDIMEKTGRIRHFVVTTKLRDALRHAGRTDLLRLPKALLARLWPATCPQGRSATKPHRSLSERSASSAASHGVSFLVYSTAGAGSRSLSARPQGPAHRMPAVRSDSLGDLRLGDLQGSDAPKASPRQRPPTPLSARSTEGCSCKACRVSRANSLLRSIQLDMGLLAQDAARAGEEPPAGGPSSAETPSARTPGEPLSMLSCITSDAFAALLDSTSDATSLTITREQFTHIQSLFARQNEEIRRLSGDLQGTFQQNLELTTELEALRRRLQVRDVCASLDTGPTDAAPADQAPERAPATAQTPLANVLRGDGSGDGSGEAALLRAFLAHQMTQFNVLASRHSLSPAAFSFAQDSIDSVRRGGDPLALARSDAFSFVARLQRVLEDATRALAQMTRLADSVCERRCLPHVPPLAYPATAPPENPLRFFRAFVAHLRLLKPE